MDELMEIITEAIEHVCEDICDNYCKYRDTADEDMICDAIREKGSCPLDKLHWTSCTRRGVMNDEKRV